MTKFTDLGLAEVLLRALTHEGYDAPTPIQAKAIPPLLLGRDLLGIAQTGTGKTAAFALPIINRLISDRRSNAARQARVLVLAPTRELAVQIGDSFRAYGRFAKISVAVIVGGVSMGPQVQALAHGVDVVVATPGRLLDHMQQGKILLNAVEVVVLDEADHMLDLGFIVPIRQIIAKTPKTRQSLFFSATMPKEIAGLAGDMLRDPVQIAVTPVATTVERVTQQVIMCDTAAKRDILAGLLAAAEFKRAIVFTRTKRGADRVSLHLEAAGISSNAIHGNKSQSQRQRALDGFRSGRTRVLVATDIAARGIDVDGVTHVVNFELPEVPESYVHRIGRTARAGADGAAISLCDNSERNLLRAIEKLTRQTVPMIDRRGERPAAAPIVKPVERRDYARPEGQRHTHEGRKPSLDGRKPSQDSRKPAHDGRKPESRGHGGRPSEAGASDPRNASFRPNKGDAGKAFQGRPPRGRRSGSGNGGAQRPAV